MARILLKPWCVHQHNPRVPFQQLSAHCATGHIGPTDAGQKAKHASTIALPLTRFRSGILQRRGRHSQLPLLGFLPFIPYIDILQKIPICLFKNPFPKPAKHCSFFKSPKYSLLPAFPLSPPRPGWPGMMGTSTQQPLPTPPTSLHLCFVQKKPTESRGGGERILDVPVPPNGVLASVVGLFFPLATGSGNI